ncbi:hypothetical protein ICN49_02400 [Polynucleobacter sp. MWH-Mekk-B1]|uniref:hypothetical protein n=1 Tax=Polynucleobacter finlandensis TaxID=1855894 RepID=UPI001C0C61B7|nr:hypothetical protein [Polynucleobacter finlandensis]MBU3543763.1 hypothetical protein [Polynucleobacter finlandensis]
MPNPVDEKVVVIRNIPMQGSYLWVYIFAIAMIFLTFVSSIATQSKVLIGPVIWGYVAYLMHKQKNASLVTFFKALLIITGVGGAAFILIFFNKYGFEENSAGDLPTIEYILMTIFGLAVFYSFMKFFQRQIKSAEDGHKKREEITSNANYSKPLILTRQWSQRLKKLITGKPLLACVTMVCITVAFISWLQIYMTPLQICLRGEEERNIAKEKMHPLGNTEKWAVREGFIEGPSKISLRKCLELTSSYKQGN